MGFIRKLSDFFLGMLAMLTIGNVINMLLEAPKVPLTSQPIFNGGLVLAFIALNAWVAALVLYELMERKRG